MMIRVVGSDKPVVIRAVVVERIANTQEREMRAVVAKTESRHARQ